MAIKFVTFFLDIYCRKFKTFACITVSFHQSRDKTSMAKCHCPKTPMRKKLASNPNPKTQSHKSVTFYTLSFCPWHSDRTPFPSHHNNDIAYEIIVYGANERSRTKAGQLPNTLSHFGCSTRKSKQNLSAHPFQIQLYLNHTTTLSLL